MSLRRAYLAPSILSANFARLGDECERVAAAGADWIHVDVMDGHFVPNLTFGAPVVRCLRPVTKLPLDVHLMIAEPARYLSDFIKAGADSITFHIEAVDDPRPLLERIHQAGRRGGVALKPNTPAEDALACLDLCDLVLVMTVEPGFGGQRFLREPLDKIRLIMDAARDVGVEPEIEVDGGIDLSTVRIARAAGATVFVAGSAIYGSPDVPATVARFKELLDSERDLDEVESFDTDWSELE